MADYFPVLIDTSREIKTSQDSTGSKGIPLDMVFIDRNGVKFEPELVNAVLNGIEIDT